MISYSQISDMKRKAARDSQKAGQVPAIWKGTKDNFRMAFIGDRNPRGWKRTKREHLFVDSSGWGGEYELAMTQEAFFNCLTPGLGYAVIEQGQFQCYVAEFSHQL